MEVIVFPDAAATVIQFLFDAYKARDLGLPIGSRVMDEPRFVCVYLVDAEISSLVIQRSTLKVEVWVDDGAQSIQIAQDLGQLTRALIGSMRGTVQSGNTIYNVTDGQRGLADTPDVPTGKPQYSFEVVIGMRGTAQ